MPPSPTLRDAAALIAAHATSRRCCARARSTRWRAPSSSSGCEHLQRRGVQVRGACKRRCGSLDADAAARGVVTHSSGNHGAALAWPHTPRHCRPRGRARGRGEIKLAAIERYGAQLHPARRRWPRAMPPRRRCRRAPAPPWCTLHRPGDRRGRARRRWSCCSRAAASTPWWCRWAAAVWSAVAPLLRTGWTRASPCSPPSPKAHPTPTSHCAAAYAGPSSRRTPSPTAARHHRRDQFRPAAGARCAGAAGEQAEIVAAMRRVWSTSNGSSSRRARPCLARGAAPPPALSPAGASVWCSAAATWTSTRCRLRWAVRVPRGVSRASRDRGDAEQGRGDERDTRGLGGGGTLAQHSQASNTLDSGTTRLGEAGDGGRQALHHQRPHHPGQARSEHGVVGRSRRRRRRSRRSVSPARARPRRRGQRAVESICQVVRRSGDAAWRANRRLVNTTERGPNWRAHQRQRRAVPPPRPCQGSRISPGPARRPPAGPLPARGPLTQQQSAPASSNQNGMV